MVYFVSIESKTTNVILESLLSYGANEPQFTE